MDFENRKHRTFILELKRKRASESVLAGYKKVNDNENSGAINNKPLEKEKKKKSREKENVISIVPQEAIKPQDKTGSKKKQKFSNFYSQDSKIILLKSM